MCGCNMHRFWVILVMLLTREFCSYFFDYLHGNVALARRNWLLTLGWLRLDGSMAETVEVVNEFLADIGSRVAPLGQRELESLNELKSKDEKLVSPVGDGGIAYWWDK